LTATGDRSIRPEVISAWAFRVITVTVRHRTPGRPVEGRMDIAYARAGTGAPLLLLHALGLDRGSWDPVMPLLTAAFDVIAVDLPGFGASPPLPGEPSPAVLAAAVAEFLDEIGVAHPHVAGNSLGGWVSLELAALRPVASLTLVAPAGLWRGPTPLYNRVSLRATRWMAAHAGRLLSRLVGLRLFRALVLGQSHGRPGRLTPEYARATIHAIGTCPGFDGALAGTLRRRYTAGPPLGAPVTVAFGTRDRVLLRRQSRHVEQLPPGARVVSLKGCGHIAMADDPQAVASLIATSTGQAAQMT